MQSSVLALQEHEHDGGDVPDGACQGAGLFCFYRSEG